MSKILDNFDMWYGDSTKDVTRVTFSFSDLDCVYRGNMYIGDKCVGDYTVNDFMEIKRKMPQLHSELFGE